MLQTCCLLAALLAGVGVRQRKTPLRLVSTTSATCKQSCEQQQLQQLLALTSCLCCFTRLQLIPVELVSAYKRAMLNIHPGLLPSFGGKGLYGERVHAAVIKSGAR
jgi:folate-dependent phosphoribosylglycinamide formyltransferase PurN